MLRDGLRNHDFERVSLDSIIQRKGVALDFPIERDVDAPAHIDVKDAGLDFVVWKAMPDGRKGHLFLLGQCACGDDWEEKLHDIDVDALTQSWIRPLSVAAPVRVFATPHHIPNETHFADVNQRGGLTLDRARIVLIAETLDHRDFIKQTTKDPFAELVRLVIPGFQGA